MTLKEFDIQIALGALTITFTKHYGLFWNNVYGTNLGRYYYILKVGDKKYSSREYLWIVNLDKNHTLIDTNIIRSALIEEGILI